MFWLCVTGVMAGYIKYVTSFQGPRPLVVLIPPPSPSTPYPLLLFDSIILISLLPVLQ